MQRCEVVSRYAVAELPPEVFALLDRGKKQLLKAWTHPTYQDVANVLLLSKQQWYTGNRPAMARFTQAYTAAVDWMYNPADRDEAIQTMVEELRADPRDAAMTYEQFVVDMKAYPRSPRVDMNHLTRSFANLKKLGEKVPDDLTPLVDNSLVDEALK